MSAKSADKSILAETPGKYIADTTAYTGDWMAIQALTATVFAAGTTSTSITGTLTSMALPAGATLWGRFNAIKLTSGTVIAYTNK
jgi:hypothetical protein